MKYYVGIWDYFFGETIELELHKGEKRIVSKKWFEQNKSEGLVQKIDKDLVKVHILDPFAPLENLIHNSEEEISHYRIEYWEIGKDISNELIDEYRDDETGEIYVLMAKKEDNDTPKPMILKKSVWELGKNGMDGI